MVHNTLITVFPGGSGSQGEVVFESFWILWAKKNTEFLSGEAHSEIMMPARVNVESLARQEIFGGVDSYEILAGKKCP